MDSMPATSFSLPSLNIFKSSTPEEDESPTQHVENTASGIIASIVNATSDFHLPRGVTETDDEKEKKWYIGSIDCGTTSSRFLIFDGTGNPIASHQIEFENIYPDSGWHEHDPMELFESVQQCIDGAYEEFLDLGHTRDQIKTIGITTQRETTICWDSETGEPLYNAVVWPDTRTSSIVRELKARDGADKLQDICGLPISTYPSGVKLLWMLRNVPNIKKAYDENRLSFGTVDSWLIYKLNGGKEANVHVTDTTNASRTMFMNLKTLEYDDTILDFFQISRKNVTLPKIVPSADKEAFGKLASTQLEGMTITGCLGDQSAALVGQCGFTPGSAKSTYGTGCFVLYNVGTEPVFSTHGLLATVAYDFGGGRKPIYALEGSVAVAGSGVKFLMNNLGFIAHSSKITELAESVKDNGGVVFVTAFSGLFAPYWIDDAKGTLFGITAHTRRGHIARATLEATCYQTKAILDAMEKDSKHKLGSLAVDGGMSNSDLTMQTQANILGIDVDRPVMRETTALGAAIAAGFAIDIWTEFEELKEINKDDRTIFEPQISEKKRNGMFKKWEQAVQMCRGWVLEDDVESEEEEHAKSEKDAAVAEKAAVQEEKKENLNVKEQIQQEKEAAIAEKEDATKLREANSTTESASEEIVLEEKAVGTAKVLLQREEKEANVPSGEPESVAVEAKSAETENSATSKPDSAAAIEADAPKTEIVPEKVDDAVWPVVGESEEGTTDTKPTKVEEDAVSAPEPTKEIAKGEAEVVKEEQEVKADFEVTAADPDASIEELADVTDSNVKSAEKEANGDGQVGDASKEAPAAESSTEVDNKVTNGVEAKTIGADSASGEGEVKSFSEALTTDVNSAPSKTEDSKIIEIDVKTAEAPSLKAQEWPTLGEEVQEPKSSTSDLNAAAKEFSPGKVHA